MLRQPKNTNSKAYDVLGTQIRLDDVVAYGGRHGAHGYIHFGVVRRIHFQRAQQRAEAGNSDDRVRVSLDRITEEVEHRYSTDPHSPDPIQTTRVRYVYHRVHAATTYMVVTPLDENDLLRRFPPQWQTIDMPK